MKRQKRIAVINDFSGFGRCSLTVSLPIISAAGIQCCALPTAVLSNHTGYESYFFDDYTDKMKPYYMEWQKLGLRFDGIYAGFLGSERQIDIVLDFIRRFADPHTKIIIDPVMGDDGKTYATLTGQHCSGLKRLAARADILTPNLTEACILTGYPYRADISSEEELVQIAQALIGAGSKNVVITGINDGNNICNYICTEKRSYCKFGSQRIGVSRAGSGDVFASVIAADAVNGASLTASAQRADAFVRRAISLTNSLSQPPQDGLSFEPLLHELYEGGQS